LDNDIDGILNLALATRNLTMQIKILITGRNKEALTSLEDNLPGHGCDISIRHISNGHADPLYGVADLPDLLIFHLDDSNEPELACLIERPAELRPATLIIGPGGNTHLMRMAMKAGAVDYLEDPASESDLAETLEQVKTRVTNQAAVDEGQLIAVVSAKGGSGASFVSVNLGHMMAAMSQKNTALLDLDLQYASLGQYLDLKCEHGLMQALDVIDSLDETAMDAYMAKHKSGVSLLGPLPDEIVLTRDVPLERFSQLLEQMKSHYDFTVVDQPRDLHEMSAAVYERADRVLIVIQQELANVRDASRLRQILLTEMAVPEHRITVVINRYDKNAAVELSDICRALSMEKSEFVLVPNDYRDVAESMNIGVPMLDHSRNSAVTKALMKFGDRLTGVVRGPAKSRGLSKALSTLIRGQQHGA
jgi:pilus assembly protein CpaE